MRTRKAAVASPSVFGSVAMMTSPTSTPSTEVPSRTSSSRMRSLSGPIDLIGFSAPPSTWYSPRYSRVRSTAWTSLASSTTQILEASRRGSEQIRQRCSAETLPHTSQ